MLLSMTSPASLPTWMICLSLSLSTEQDSIPQVAPFLDPELFEAHFTKSRFNLNTTIIPEALPLGMKPQDYAAQPALYYGCLFFAAYECFSRGISQFFWDHIGEIKANNPDLYFGEDSLAPMLTKLNRRNAFGEQLHDGQRDSNGELIWKVFGGFSTHCLEGIIMGSRAKCQSTGEGVVLKAELFAMLIQLVFVASCNEICPSGRDLPQVVVINFTDQYARIVQGTLTRPRPNSNEVDFRISVSEQLLYVNEKTDKIISDAWKRLLGWTFCRAAKAEGGKDDAGDKTTSAVPEENVNLIVSKTRERRADDREDEAMRIASKSTVASLKKNKDMSAVDEQEYDGSSPASSSSSS
ncbi:hypothetical protein O988_05938 [Pseudogymnoascus sp. VKM F-3808]|nr:hypothetical protein O988_05938 [Pseudogymnoascus sp. VKM F-3808]